MKVAVILGIALIACGAIVLGHDHYTYTSVEKILAVGPITATAEQKHTVTIPPVFGWLLIVGGACSVAFGAYFGKR